MYRIWLRTATALAGLAALSLSLADAAHAQTFAYTNGSGQSASAIFSVVGSQLWIELENLGDPAEANGEVLTGIVWLDGNAGAYAPDAISASALINNDGSTFGGDAARLGKGWQYKSSPILGFNHGLSATGAGGAFGPVGNFSSPGEILNGVDWGIVNGVTSFGGNQEPFADNRILFKLDGYDANALDIQAVAFNYSSDLDLRQAEVPGNNSPAPEPASLTLLATGALGLLRTVRRRRNAG